MSAPSIDRRTFLTASGACVVAFALGCTDERRLTHGPFLTHHDDGSMSWWARASRAGKYELALSGNPFGDDAVVTAHAQEEHDLTLRWTVPARTGRARSFAHVFGAQEGVSICAAGRVIARGAIGHPLSRDDAQTSIAIGSCAKHHRFPVQDVWDRMREREPDLVALLGDTPYIDSTAIDVQRERYREFYAQPQLARLFGTTPFVATWDDHDYGGNDLYGAIDGRQNSRRAFLEYHGAGEWGCEGQGVYTRRRVGPIEVYLLDTRWFADAEPSPFDPSKPSLLGREQTRWLQEGLLASDAPIKVLASGMMWNDAVDRGKKDLWRTWRHERDGLFAWIGRSGICGVVLASGGPHRCRVVQHSTKPLAGYDLLEFVASPLANAVNRSADFADPGLLFDGAYDQSFLLLSAKRDEADTVLSAEMIDATGSTRFRLERKASQLAAV